MKNLLQSVFILALFLMVYKGSAQITFGAKAGLNLANISQSFEESEYEFDTKMRPAFHIGATVDYKLSETFFLQSGLLFTSKGFNYDLDELSVDGMEYDGSAGTTLNYLEIPIWAAYNIKGFHIMAGPYFAFGIGGKTKYDYTVTYDGESESVNEEYNMKPSFGEVSESDMESDDEFYRALDIGLNIGVGYQFGNIVANAAYSLGFGNITADYEGSDYDASDEKMSNRVVSVSVGYKFGK